MTLQNTIEKFTTEQRAFFDHATQSGEPHELITRQQELRKAVSERSVGYNHKPALAAIAQLGSMLPAKLETDHSAKAIAAAKRYIQQGDQSAAKQLLKGAGLSLDDVGNSAPSEAVQARIIKARATYNERKEITIKQLQSAHDWNEVKAEKYFHKCYASEYKRTANLSQALPGDRPIADGARQ